MVDRQTHSGPTVTRFASDALKRALGERCIRLVVEPQHAPADIVISDQADEARYRAALAHRNRHRYRRGIERIG